MDKKAIEEKLDKLETMIETLIKQYVQKPQKSITQQNFKTFYNRVKSILPKDAITPYCIWVNEDFEDDLKHKILYPDYNNAFWYVIGEPEDIPIGFSKMKCDFYIDCAIFGDFLDDFSFKFKRQEGRV